MSVFTVVSTTNHFQIVQLSELKEELGIDGSHVDAQLTDLIDACTRDLEQDTYWQFAEKTLKLTLPRFPYNGLIELPIKPVQSVSSITYRDTDNVEQTLAGSNYRLVTLSSPAQIEITEDGTWPGTYIRADAVQVNVVVGYDDLSEIPVQARRAVKEMVKSAYNGCGDKEYMQRCINSLRWFYDVLC